MGTTNHAHVSEIHETTTVITSITKSTYRDGAVLCGIRLIRLDGIICMGQDRIGGACGEPSACMAMSNINACMPSLLTGVIIGQVNLLIILAKRPDGPGYIMKKTFNIWVRTVSWDARDEWKQ